MQMLLRWASWVLCLPVLMFAAGPYFKSAWSALRQRRIGMDVSVALGILVTFIAGSQATFSGQGEVYFDSLSMFVAVLLGARLLETRARRRAAQALDALVRRLPDTVERVAEDGSASLVAPGELRVGDQLRVQVGQAFAADGVLLQGRTQVDEAALTGESTPVERGVGDEVSAGCLNLGAPVLMRADRLGAQTRYQRIVALVERALTERPAFVQATDRLAGPFLWGVLALAGLAWLGWHWVEPARATWVAVSVLIVTCPCALSIGAPVALIAAAGQLARRGVLVQKVDALEALTHIDTVVFDKTGTLTEDRLVPAQITPLADADDRSAPAWLALAASLGTRSRHPLARALAAAQETADAARTPPGTGTAPDWQDVTEQAGAGLQARCADTSTGQPEHWRLGSAAWCGLATPGADAPARPAVWLARLDGVVWQPQVRFEFDEVMRADAPAAIARLQDQGLAVHVLSGDQPASVAALLQRLERLQPAPADGQARPAIQWRALCTPQDKLDALQALQQAGRRVLMVGDGINDAPVLARADVSVAMGSAAALAQARADVVVLSNHIADIELLHGAAARCLRIVRQNLFWALAYNLACVPLALAGWLPPWAAGLGMAASSLLVVLNALRLTQGGPRFSAFAR
jgi:Cu2+-exporting ATPase